MSLTGLFAGKDIAVICGETVDLRRPTGTFGKSMVPVVERLEERIVPEPNSGCWLWLGRLDGDGYGGISLLKRELLAHRVIYEIFRGAILPGFEIDHLCRVRSCVNPDHQEPVSHLVNMRRSAPATKTHCRRGHPYEGNLYLFRETRHCLKCVAINQRAYQRRKKAQ